MSRLYRIFLPLFFCVAPPALASEAPEPLLRTELEQTSAIPGQPIVLRITVLAPTWLLESPVFPSFEVPNVMVRLPQRAAGPTSERVEGETWSGVTRAYRLYPMIAGSFAIPPRPLLVTYAHPETRAPITVELRSEAISFKGALPRGQEDLDPFIAAESLEIEQKIEGKPGELIPGGAVTRSVTAKVKGLSPLFLPPLIPALESPAFSAYPKEPVVAEQEDLRGLSGERSERVTYVATAGGKVAVPPIILRWYNLKTKTVEVAEVEGFDMAANGSPPATDARGLDWRGLALWILGTSIVLLILAIIALRLRSHISAWQSRRRDVYLASEAYAWADVKAALRKRDLGSVLGAIALWSSRLPPAGSAEEERLSETLTKLGAARYGPGGAVPPDALWSDTMDALVSARRQRLQEKSVDNAGRRLQPLNPLSAQ